MTAAMPKSLEKPRCLAQGDQSEYHQIVGSINSCHFYDDVGDNVRLLSRGRVL